MAIPKLDHALQKIESTLTNLKEHLEDSSKAVTKEHIESVIETLKKHEEVVDRELKQTDIEAIPKSVDHKLKKMLESLLSEEVYEQRTANLGNIAESLWKVVQTCDQDLNRLKEKVEIKRGGDVDFEKLR